MAAYLSRMEDDYSLVRRVGRYSSDRKGIEEKIGGEKRSEGLLDSIPGRQPTVEARDSRRADLVLGYHKHVSPQRESSASATRDVLNF